MPIQFLNPWAGLTSLLAIPIILLYMLRLRRRPVTVPSLLLWEAAARDRHANRPWQKLRRNWLLALQLLALLSLTLALMRPALPTPLAVHGQAILLLDVSASMQGAHPDGGTRFAAAVRELHDVAAALSPADTVTLITVEARPRLWLRGGDARALRQALDEIAPTDGVADWQAAAALAAGSAAGEEVTTLLVTDAAISAPIPALPGDVRVLPVGGEQANVGVVAFSLRRHDGGWTAFVRLHNAGPATAREVTLTADGSVVAHRAVDLPAESDVALTFESVPVTAWAEVQLDAAPPTQDALRLDDRAWVAFSAHQAASVLLVTPGNRFLHQALRSLPGTELATTDTLPGGELATPAPGLTVVDGPLTGTLPTSNLWLIAPGAGTPCGEPGAVITPTTAARGEWDHPLLHYVDWENVHVARARRYEPPADADVLIETAAGPLLWAIERPGQRIACTAFDLHDSDLPLRLAFPILTSNLVGWLMPAVSSTPVTPHPAGEPWTPPLPPDATAATLVTPDGASLPMDLDQPQVDVSSSAAGLYRIEAETAAGAVTRYAALSLLDSAESDLRPREIQVGQQVIAPTAPETEGWREVRAWIAAAALALLLIEAGLWWGRELRGLLPFSSLKEIKATLARWGRRVAPGPLVLRAVLFILLLLSLLDLRWMRRTRDLAVVFLLDRSASTREAWEEEVAFVTDALAEKAPGDRAGIVVFGGEAWVDRSLSTGAELGDIATAPRADATDIEQAVRLGLALLPTGAPSRMVLLSDGLQTTGEAAAALREATAQGVDVQLVTVGETGERAEVWLANLNLPARVYPGDRAPVRVTANTNQPQALALTWQAAGGVGRQDWTLTEASETRLVSFEAQAPGLTPVRVCLHPDEANDTFAENNCADGWVRVEGPPRVLIVGEAQERAALGRALAQSGLTIEEAEANALPMSVQGLADYAALALVNTPARDFSPQTLQALRSFVRDLGGGLVAVGGPQSYGVGGWLGTPLEEALPVEMRVRDPQRFPPLAMAIVIDKSGSMGVEEAGMTKIRLAGEAAIRVAETLNDADMLAVVAYDDRPADTLGPVTMAEREALITQLQRLQAGGGGIYVRDSLIYTGDLLRDEARMPGVQRHLLLLADGADAEHQEGALAEVQELVAAETTVSVVAIGSGRDVPFLQQLAEAGNGRFYLTEQAADLPAIFAEETARAKRSYIVEESFYPAPVTTWAPVAGIQATPPLQGYVATTPKSAAQVVWEALEGDPLLAVWQYGLGRSVAWTSDASGRWAAGWTSWEAFSRFWSSIARHVLPPPADEGIALQIQAEDETAHVTADIIDDEGAYVDGLDLQLAVQSPMETRATAAEEEMRTVPLRQTAPGRYEGSFSLRGQAGLLLALHGDRHLTVGWSPPAPAETVPGDAEAALTRLAQRTEATLATSAANVFAHDLSGRAPGQPLGMIWLWLAVFLWPLDIAWRRLALTRNEITRFVRKITAQATGRVLEARTPAREKEAPPTLAGTLRQRREQRAEETSPRGNASRIAGEGLSPEASPSKPKEKAPEPPDEGTLAARLKRRLRDE